MTHPASHSGKHFQWEHTFVSITEVCNAPQHAGPSQLAPHGVAACPVLDQTICSLNGVCASQLVWSAKAGTGAAEQSPFAWACRHYISRLLSCAALHTAWELPFGSTASSHLLQQLLGGSCPGAQLPSWALLLQQPPHGWRVAAVVSVPSSRPARRHRQPLQTCTPQALTSLTAWACQARLRCAAVSRASA
jgi:hypothetical protein